MVIVRFTASPLGRFFRIVLGAAMIEVAYNLPMPATWILALVGLLPLVGGIFNVWLLAPLFGAPLMGRNVPAAA